MTLPNERFRAVLAAQSFLRCLLDPKQTPRVPKNVRRWARSVLKHYPSEFDMRQAEKDFKRIFGTVQSCNNNCQCPDCGPSLTSDIDS